MHSQYYFYVLKSYLFSERRKGKEEERERKINVLLPLPAHHRGLAHNPGTHTDRESNGDPQAHKLALNPLRNSSQGNIHIF